MFRTKLMCYRRKTICNPEPEYRDFTKTIDHQVWDPKGLTFVAVKAQSQVFK